MADSHVDSHAAFRRSAYWLMIAIGMGAALRRILAVDSVDMARLEANKVSIALEQDRKSLEAAGLSGDALDKELARLERRYRAQPFLERPFLSANDRSRWCTVRALVEPEMRVEGAPYAIDKVIQQPKWDTIDMVKHNGHFYSSKPPLQATLIAAAYWPIHRATGATLGTHPYEIGRAMLVLFNLVPMLIYFAFLARLIERWGATNWGRLFTMAAAVFATFLTTFVVTINNHVPAAVCAALALYAAVRIWFDGERRLRYFILAGLFGALATVNELPALSLLALIMLLLVWIAPRPTFTGFLPTVVLVAVAFFATNWIAYRTLEPAYLHRASLGAADWYDYSFERNGREVESYWRHPVGVDRGEPRWNVYAAHVLVGHHGIFSLTPIWFLSFAGMGAWLAQKIDARKRWLAAGIAAISIACIAFYLCQPPMNRNYGGVTSGLRWMFWLAPLWLLAIVPAVDGMASRGWARAIALILLAISVLSASYPTWNPWIHPWLMVYMQYLGVA